MESVLIATGAVLSGVVLFGLIVTLRVAQAGGAGKSALLRADADVHGQRARAARQDLVAAAEDFRRMNSELHSLGPVLSVARVIPLVRIQVRATDTFANTGIDLSQAGLRLLNAAELAQQASATPGASSTSLSRLRALQLAVRSSIGSIDSATTRLDGLNGYRLIGPLSEARDQLSHRLISIRGTARSADDGLSALISFTGGMEPRRYLVLSQNPDELRPTGGYIGSYGVLTATAGQLRLEQYANSDEWTTTHPGDLVPTAQLGSPFRFYDPPLPQSLANINTVPDWPQVAQSALALWRQGGEQADGVVSFTPEFMARVLAVLGPVSVPSYGEIITAQNVDERLNFYTHLQPPPPGSDRKAFLGPLGQAVMAKLVSAQASQWSALGTALAKSFASRDLMVWSSDPAVESTLATRGWDGALPAATGDFFSNGDFEYEAKNGRGIKRSFDHQVTIRADGSARITTTINITNTEGPSASNDNSLFYVTLYAPSGATLDPSASDHAASGEPAIAGHPAIGWFVPVPANTTTTLKVVWDAPAVAVRLPDGSWKYQLRWLHVVDNTGDVVHLRVDLPAHARWTGSLPPTHSLLTQDFSGSWTYRL